MDDTQKPILESYEKWHVIADQEVCGDYGFTSPITSSSEQTRNHLEALALDKGVNSFMLCPAFKNMKSRLDIDDFFSLLQTCQKIGDIVFFHCKEFDLSTLMTQDVYATFRVIASASKNRCPLYVLQVHTIKAAQVLRKLQEKGSAMYGEAKLSMASEYSKNGSQYNYCTEKPSGYMSSPSLSEEQNATLYLMTSLKKGILQSAAIDRCGLVPNDETIQTPLFSGSSTEMIESFEYMMSFIWEKAVMSLSSETNASLYEDEYWGPYSVYSDENDIENVPEVVLEELERECRKGRSPTRMMISNPALSQQIPFEADWCFDNRSTAAAEGKQAREETIDELRKPQSSSRKPTQMDKIVNTGFADQKENLAEVHRSENQAEDDLHLAATTERAASSLEFRRRPPTRSGGRNLLDSTFSLPGFWIILIGFNYSLVRASDLDNQTFTSDWKDAFRSDLDDPDFVRILDHNEFLRNFYALDEYEDPWDPLADPIYIKFLKNVTEQIKVLQPPLPPGTQVKWPKVLIDPESGGETGVNKSRYVKATYEPRMFPGSVPAPLTHAEQMKFVAFHMQYRWNYTIPSADTEYMVYNELLAQYSLAMVYWCVTDQVFPADIKTWFPQRVGQNLYSGTTPDPARAMWLWYLEILNMNFIQWHCYGPECGHLNQMQNSKSREIGCNRHLCWPKKGEKKDTYLTVCHYYLPGNQFGADGKEKRGFQIGKSCSRCYKEFGGWCWFNESTCVRKSDIVKYQLKDVNCPLKCQNCGFLNADNCTCECKAGWDGLDCSQPCANFADFCNLLKGDQCDRDELPIREHLCRAKCGACTIQSQNTKYDDQDSDCCAGITCRPDHEANASNFCQCDLTCPSPTCDEDNNQYDDKEAESSSLKTEHIVLITISVILVIILSLIACACAVLKQVANLHM